jgi:hypothetical protein
MADSVSIESRQRPGKTQPERFTQQCAPAFRRVDVKKILIISGTVMGLVLSLPVQSHAQQQTRSAPAKQAAGGPAFDRF